MISAASTTTMLTFVHRIWKHKNNLKGWSARREWLQAQSASANCHENAVTLRITVPGDGASSSSGLLGLS